MTHYHKRSNIDSTFSAIKRKFGENVVSKCETAMVHEVLCKILCHNLTGLIQEQEDLGIVPVGRMRKKRTASGRFFGSHRLQRSEESCHVLSRKNVKTWQSRIGGIKKPTGSLYHLSHGQREPVGFLVRSLSQSRTHSS